MAYNNITEDEIIDEVIDGPDDVVGDESAPTDESTGFDRLPDVPYTGPSAEEIEEAKALEDAMMSDQLRRQRWQSRKPRIEHLKDGIVETNLDGEIAYVPLFDIGERIVVEARTRHLKQGEDGFPWLCTIVGHVKSIDDDTGVVTVYDEETDVRNRSIRCFSYKDGLHAFKLVPARGNPFDVKIVKPVRPPPAPGEVRRGRGRPKGTLNRPKEVIKAEKEARKAEKGKK